MANISSAYGTIEIKAEKPSEIKELIDKTIGNADYSTEIYDDWDGKQGHFLGNGRWAYEANCRNFWDWVKYYVKERTELKPLFEKVKAKDFEIVLDFVDNEPAMEVLYSMTYRIRHKAGEDECVGGVWEEKSYDYTPENLVALEVFENLEDAREHCGGDNG